MSSDTSGGVADEVTPDKGCTTIRQPRGWHGRLEQEGCLVGLFTCNVARRKKRRLS
uniref:Uncharacterized protein n=1 Tax=Cucumis sativus TaxID=3659 RepID=A0A0A0KRP0_CUCSA